ncbi:MAG: nitroreductase family protein [Flavobacteriales bacterium]
MSEDFATIDLPFERLPEQEMRDRAKGFLEQMSSRRSVRHFSSDPIPLDVIDDCIAAAGTAPSGANKQPWHFAVVTDPDVKHQLRLEAEKEEQRNYAERMSEKWKADLAHLGTDADKPHFDDAPVVVVMFRKPWCPGLEGREKNYYVNESVGIAAGLFLSALHHAGLVTVTHTPSPMDFCGRVLGRPEHEKAFLVLPIGYPADGCKVPDIQRFELSKIRSLHRKKKKSEK